MRERRPARLALASLVMHSYHWGMTASPLALDLFLTMSGAGPHTPWSEWRERSIGLSSLKRGDESDSKFQEILRRNLATTSKALKNANRLSKVIQERLRKRDGAARVARHMGPTVSGRPRRRRKLREALPGPGVPDAAEEEESLLEESLFFDSEEPSPKESWPRTRRFWRRLRGDVRVVRVLVGTAPVSGTGPVASSARGRPAGARATQSARRELALNRTATEASA